MAYTKTNWIDNITKLNAENMNHIEDGIAAIKVTDVIFEGDQNGIDKDLLKDDYTFYVIKGYKENVAEPNSSIFIIDATTLSTPASWSVKLVANSWDYNLRMSVDSTENKVYFYSETDYAGSTIFRVTKIIGIRQS